MELPPGTYTARMGSTIAMAGVYLPISLEVTPRSFSRLSSQMLSRRADGGFREAYGRCRGVPRTDLPYDCTSPEPDISIWPRSGHLYLALTTAVVPTCKCRDRPT